MKNHKFNTKGYIHISEWRPRVLALEKDLAEAQAEIERKDKLIEQMRQALSWYDENVSNCNRHGREGDNARNRLARDGGQQAKFALEAAGRGE